MIRKIIYKARIILSWKRFKFAVLPVVSWTKKKSIPGGLPILLRADTSPSATWNWPIDITQWMGSLSFCSFPVVLMGRLGFPFHPISFVNECVHWIVMTYSSVVGNECNSSSSNVSGISLWFSSFRESNRTSPSKPYIRLSSNAAFEFFTELYTHENMVRVLQSLGLHYGSKLRFEVLLGSKIRLKKKKGSNLNQTVNIRLSRTL